MISKKTKSALKWHACTFFRHACTCFTAHVSVCKNPCACRHVHVFCACFIEGGDGPNRTGQDFEIFISIFLVYGLLCDLGIGCISSISLFVINEGISLFTYGFSGCFID